MLAPEHSSTARSGSNATGGGHYDAIVTGTIRNYTFSLIPRAQLTTTNATLQSRVRTIAQQITATLNDFENQALGMTVEEFLIGKAQAKTRARRHFDAEKPTTWTVGGSGCVGNRWNKYREKGYHALVVVAAITRDMIPPGPAADQQDYALAVEAALHYWFLFDQHDTRFKPSQVTWHPGKIKTTYVVSCIYVAVKLRRDHSKPVPDLVCPNELCKAGIWWEDVDTSEKEIRLETVLPPQVNGRLTYRSCLKPTLNQKANMRAQPYFGLLVLNVAVTTAFVSALSSSALTARTRHLLR